jgi:hypothetical protein
MPVCVELLCLDICVQVVQAFSDIKRDYKSDVSQLTTAELRTMGQTVCGASSTDIALLNPVQFW